MQSIRETRSAKCQARFGPIVSDHSRKLLGVLKNQPLGSRFKRQKGKPQRKLALENRADMG
jgi:hypothetical protein